MGRILGMPPMLNTCNVINTINNTDTVNGCNGMVGDDISERLSVT